MPWDISGRLSRFRKEYLLQEIFDSEIGVDHEQDAIMSLQFTNEQDPLRNHRRIRTFWRVPCKTAFQACDRLTPKEVQYIAVIKAELDSVIFAFYTLPMQNNREHQSSANLVCDQMTLFSNVKQVYVAR